MMARSSLAPRTSSVGRLFDAVAALVGLGSTNRFEGDAAMALEFAAEGTGAPDPYPIPLGQGDPALADWAPLIEAVLADCRAGVSAGTVSARFHESLAALAEDVAVRVGAPRVALAGGCFQNARLTLRVGERLARRGFDVHTPRAFPPNDGGISLGQVLVASRRFFEEGATCA
jgi:hydrogenase maturation protein HypF